MWRGRAEGGTSPKCRAVGGHAYPSSASSPTSPQRAVGFLEIAALTSLMMAYGQNTCGRPCGGDGLRPKYMRVGHPGAGAMNLRPYMADALRCDVWLTLPYRSNRSNRSYRRAVDARELSPKVGACGCGPPHRASLRRHYGVI
jgi:hypothetical protein